MERFEPELGQMAFTNTPWRELQMNAAVERALATLGEEIARRDLAESEPTSNSGSSYANEVFAMRAYCWCDGNAEGHEDGCPPNFEWVGHDFTACWYKWVGRGNSQSRKMASDEVASLLAECLASLPPGDPEGKKRKQLEARRRERIGMQRCECGHARWLHESVAGPNCTGEMWGGEEGDFGDLKQCECREFTKAKREEPR